MPAWIAENRLSGAATALVLEPGEYSMQQVERPQVPGAELRDALRWKLKDSLGYPASDAIVDFFETPAARQQRNDIVQVVAAPRTLLKPRCDILRQSSLDLRRIDIAEFALRNLVSRALAAAETTVLLMLQAQRGMLVVCREDQLYIARTLDYGLNRLGSGETGPGQWNDTDDRIALEIQRTMDYYDSHFGQAPVKRLVLVGDHPAVQRLRDYAASALGIRCELAGSGTLWAPMPDSGRQAVSPSALALGAALGLD
jgi:MSHA biogenesis protein MshI